MCSSVNPDRETINRRAGCGKTARPVRREGEPMRLSLPLFDAAAHPGLEARRPGRECFKKVPRPGEFPSCMGRVPWGRELK